MPERTYNVSREELERLRRQIGDLKGVPLESKHASTLIESMDRLYEALSRLIVIFETANRDMAEEAVRGTADDSGKLDRILDQNEKIARAIVQLADVVKQNRAIDPQRVQQYAAYQLPPIPPPQQSTQPVSPPPLPPPTFTQQEFTPAPVDPLLEQALPTNALPSLPSLPPLPTPVSAPTRTPTATPASSETTSPRAPAPPPAPFSAPALPPLSTSSAPPSMLPPIRPPTTQQSTPTPAPSSQGLPAFPQLSTMQPMGTTGSQQGFSRVSVLPSSRLPALREQDSFMQQQVNVIQPLLSPDSAPVGPPPPPPPPSVTQKRGILNRFSFS